MEAIKEVVAGSQEQDNFILKSTNVDNVDKVVDCCMVESTYVDNLHIGYNILVPADDDILHQIEEYLKFVEIPYEVVK